MTSALQVVIFLAVLFAPLRLLPVPDVPGGPLRLDLHDPGHHRGEVPRRLQAHLVQVSRRQTTPVLRFFKYFLGKKVYIA